MDSISERAVAVLEVEGRQCRFLKEEKSRVSSNRDIEYHRNKKMKTIKRSLKRGTLIAICCCVVHFELIYQALVKVCYSEMKNLEEAFEKRRAAEFFFCLFVIFLNALRVVSFAD